MRAVKSSTCSRLGPSTITRASGSVPENLTSTRPDPPKDLSQARISRCTSGMPSSGRFSRTRMLIERLRIDFEVGRQFVQAGAGLADDLENAQRRQKPVAGGGILAEDHVARLLAAQRRARPQHLLQHVFVAYRRPHHPDALAFERLLQARDSTSRWRSTRLPGRRPAAFRARAASSSTASPSTMRPLAVTNMARSASPSNATPQSALAVAHRLAEVLDVQRAATVRLMFRPSGRQHEGIDGGAEAAEQVGRELVCGTVAAIDGEMKSRQQDCTG